LIGWISLYLSISCIWTLYLDIEILDLYYFIYRWLPFQTRTSCKRTWTVY